RAHRRALTARCYSVQYLGAIGVNALGAIRGPMADYHWIADAVAADIGAGRLRAGARLPPQREFARRRGIANSTAARVYGELVRRGLAVEIGRASCRERGWISVVAGAGKEKEGT